MAGGKPGGKSVGRVTIRVLPDTSGLRKVLKTKLDQIEKTLSLTVQVNKANVDRAAIRRSVQKQLEGFEVDVEFDSTVRAIVDKVQVDRAAIRKSMQEQFDSIKNLKVRIDPEVTKEAKKRFLDQVEKMVDEASRKKARIDVVAVTAAASAQMKWVSRPRTVELIAKLSKTSMAKVATSLAALSGARVAWTWIDDLTSALGNIDKNLPKIATSTTGITTLVAGLMATVSGLVGLGAGLAAIGPTLMVLPGLILGAGFALGTLVVAMKDAKKQLEPLADGMNELGGIIKAGYWGEARQPIIDLIQNLMPQLRKSFDLVSKSMGRFTGRLADAFGRELDDGRMTKLMAGISDSFDILSGGADAFAGAIVSLSAIAAQYVPRLSKWFVNVANTFDKWLKKTAEDGRMTQWIDNGIDALKDLGRATAGFGRQLAALWKAAERGGSAGIKGFADGMEKVADIMEGWKFQSGLAALFRGSEKAMAGLGTGISAVGDLIYDLRYDLEYFIGRAGEVFGGFVADIADALNSDEIAKGLTDFIDGLADGFDSFGDYLPDVTKGLASLGTFAGELGRQLGPVLGTTLATLSSVIDPLLTYMTDEVLPVIGPAVKDAIEDLTPALEDLSESLGPVLEDLAILGAKVLPPIVSGLSTIADILSNWSLPMLDLGLDTLTDPSVLWDEDKMRGLIQEMKKGTYGPALVEFTRFAYEWGTNWETLNEDTNVAARKFFDDLGLAFDNGGTQIESFFVDLGSAFENGGSQIEDMVTGLGESFANGWTQITDFFTTIGTELASFGETLSTMDWGQVGTDLMNGLLEGISTGWTSVLTWFGENLATVITNVKSFFGIHSPSTLFRDEVGVHLLPGLIEGLNNTIGSVFTWFGELPGKILGTLTTAGTWLKERGTAVLTGLKDGLPEGFTKVKTWLEGLPEKVTNAVGNAGSWLFETGKDVMQGLANGIGEAVGNAVKKAKEVAGKITNAVKEKFDTNSPSRLWRDEIGKMLPAGLAIGITQASGLAVDAAENVATATSAAARRGMTGWAPQQITAPTPTVRVPDFSGTFSSTFGSDRGSAPLVENLTLESHGNAKDDAEEILFALRQLNRGSHV